MSMLSTRLLLLGLVVVFVGATSLAMVGAEARGGGGAANLRIRLDPISGADYTRNSIPLRITFENVGREDVRIVRSFYGHVFPVFFSFEITREDGTPIPGVRGGGKADFPAGAMKYLELRQHEGFYFRVDLSTLLTAPEEFKPGIYDVKVTYHNQYGSNCVKGQLVSESITLDIR